MTKLTATDHHPESDIPTCEALVSRIVAVTETVVRGRLSSLRI